MAQKHANDLNGSDWAKFSISVWGDIRKTPEERRLKHPAMFPKMLVRRIMQCFTTDEDKRVLEPIHGKRSNSGRGPQYGQIRNWV